MQCHSQQIKCEILSMSAFVLWKRMISDLLSVECFTNELLYKWSGERFFSSRNIFHKEQMSCFPNY